MRTTSFNTRGSGSPPAPCAPNPLLLLSALVLAACAPHPVVTAGARSPGQLPPEPAATAPPPPAAAQPRPPLEFVHDNIAAAMAKARAEGKALFVDAWAPWCHTCLSMKHYVLSDASLRPLADRIVFADIDTDRPENAAFLERHAVSVWPTFFVIDPVADEVVGYWSGSASPRELREVLEQGARATQERADAARAPDDPARQLALAKRDHAAGAYASAIARYREAIARGGAGWSRRSDALAGLLLSLYLQHRDPTATRSARAEAAASCADVGTRYVAEVQGAALPADFAGLLLTCASALPDPDAAKVARAAAIARLRAITQHPPADASADDRADAFSLLAEGLEADGDAAGAHTAQEGKLAVLERAAREAPTPEAAAAYDYGRAMAYLALGRGDQAIKMLEERERQMPSSYEPPARLAQVLHATARDAEALPALDRAIARAYGPRRLRYLRLRAQIQGALGDQRGAVETLREEVKGHQALGKGHASERGLEDARKRLAAAEAALAAGAPTPRKGTRKGTRR